MELIDLEGNTGRLASLLIRVSCRKSYKEESGCSESDKKGLDWVSIEWGVWEDFADLVVFLPIREGTRLAG